jgi:hypothetical protein
MLELIVFESPPGVFPIRYFWVFPSGLAQNCGSFRVAIFVLVVIDKLPENLTTERMSNKLS